MKRKNSWKIALAKFLVSWKDRKDVIGALVSGSREFGTDTKNSDIDIHLVLRDGANWRERGNCIIDGYLIEYFANSIAQLKEYRKDDFDNFRHTDARMFALGRIIFDKTGSLKKLQQLSKKELKTRFQKLSKIEIELSKYSLWDELDDLKDLSHQRSKFYILSYNLLLQRILEVYRKFLGVEVSAPSKLQRYFTDSNFRKRYGIPTFIDSKFTDLFIISVDKQTFSTIKALVDYVLKKMGGFEIDGWRVRSKSTTQKKSSRRR